MDDTNRPKLILGVLLVAVIILGVFLFQKLIVSKQKSIQRVTQIRVSPSPILPASPSPATLGQAKSLPSTGAPEVALALFGVSAAVSGFFLRKFPE